MVAFIFDIYGWDTLNLVTSELALLAKPARTPTTPDVKIESLAVKIQLLGSASDADHIFADNFPSTYDESDRVDGVYMRWIGCAREGSVCSAMAF